MRFSIQLLLTFVLAATLCGHQLNAQSSNNPKSNAAAAAARAAAARAAARASTRRPVTPQVSKLSTPAASRTTTPQKQVPASRLGVSKVKTPATWNPVPNRSPKTNYIAGSTNQSVKLKTGFTSKEHLAKHIGQSPQQLSERLKNEKHLVASSSFHSKSIAESAIAKTLKAKATDVNTFISGAKAGQRMAFTYDTKSNVGIGLRRGDPVMVDRVSKVTVVVRSLGSGRFFVQTAFPNLN